MPNSKTECTWGCDVLTGSLAKVGINRIMLVTLALLPFAWGGVAWLAEAVRSLWDLVAGVGN